MFGWKYCLALLVVVIDSSTLAEVSHQEDEIATDRSDYIPIKIFGTKDPQIRAIGLSLADNLRLYENQPQKNITTLADVESQQVQCAPCKCGIPNSSRIVGGKTVTSNKYPWMAALTYNGRFYCGGSLINDQFILTAGHCTSGFKAKNMKVHLMSYDRALKNGLQYRVSIVYKANGFNVDTLHNDAALLKLSERVIFSTTVKPICLPEKDMDFNGKTATVAGWGALVYQGQATSVLREVSVPIWSNKRCRKTVYGNSITNNMLCAGFPEGKKDACQGDSGGPLIVADSNGRFVQVGIVSFGYGCAQPNEPGVYARVSKFLKWIDSKTKESCTCSSN